MIFSFLKLKELAQLKPSIKPADMAAAFNALGFEVEAEKKFSDLEGLKFGRVISTKPNPNGSNLTICEIKFSDKTRIIQTTAKNVQANMTILAFVPGARSGSTVFSAKELRQVVSEGMLASYNELGFDNELLPAEWQGNIAIFPEVALSTDFNAYLNLNDTLFDLKILSNRADANSYYVMAAELAAYFGGEVKWPRRKHGTLKATLKPITGKARALTTIEAINNFEVDLHDRLLLVKSGFKLVNHAVDLGNLTFMMTGQPVHAYDRALIGKTITAAQSSARVQVLGNKDVQLENDLVITSSKKVVAVAGVIGIAAQAVLSTAPHLVYELGQFDHTHIRKATRTVRLATAASAQSGRELSKGLITLALDFMTNYLTEFSAPQNEPRFKARTVKYRAADFAALIGEKTVIGNARYQAAKDALARLGYTFTRSGVIAPSFINGINTQQDVSEEIMRFYGYDHLKPQPIAAPPRRITMLNATKITVMRSGFQEVITYSLVKSADNFFNPHGFKQHYKLVTPFSSDHEELRHALAWSLLDIVAYHDKRKITAVNFFEMARLNDDYEVLGLVSTTRLFDEMKEIIVNLFGEGLVFKRSTNEFLHPGMSADIYRGEVHVGYLGKIHPAYRHENALVAEVRTLRPVTKFRYQEYDAAPLKSRDVTLKLAVNADLASALAPIEKLGEFVEMRVIDNFVQGLYKNVTVRLVAEAEIIKLVDELYNNEK